MYRMFGRKELVQFLQSIDVKLDRQVELLIIGGAAASLAYQVTKTTQDIDTVNRLDELMMAYEAAKAETGFDIPMATVTVHDGPYFFESRLILVEGLKLKRLRVLVPEVHDLILMKTIRGYEHDFEAIAEMIQKNRVFKERLASRIKDEMSHVIGDERRLKLNYARLMEFFDL